ncbi:hypothetical protein GOBAR_AA31743 [Gossypium barbadense]|uniref:RRM domain-containing protein n=1 Tax=Gossypium barbadense TaxID=3634 RepID=A0A2P5WCX3_GOSBA|nr:hypothetical protein GOBAR_AA31743 [Gossypium barbadense]
MTDFEACYQSNGEDLENSNGGVPSPQPREGSHGGLDDHRDSKSQHGSQIVVGIEVGSGAKGEKGEEIEMMMIITEVETMKGEGIMTEIGGTGIGVGLVDLNTDQSQGPALAHPQRAKGLVALTWHLLLQQFQIPGNNPTLPGVFPNMFPLATGQQFGGLPLMPVQAMTQQATRHARRVYVGGLSPTANEQSVATFFSQVMAAIGGNTAGPGDAVVNVYINHEKKFAFVEMRSVEEASNAMALDGIIFEGAPVKVRRPSDYNPSLAATLGPSQPSPNLNLAAVGLSPGSAGGLEGPDRIFVGGLPYYFTEAQIRELLESFGPLRGFDLVKDRETGNSKGYAFCIYQDLSVTDIACAALNGIKMGDKTLTVRRANQGATQPKPEQESILQHAQQQIALQRLMLQPQGVPTKVVCLTQAISEDDLRDDEEYGDIVEDMRQEGGKHGALVNVVIPRPNPNGESLPGVGKLLHIHFFPLVTDLTAIAWYLKVFLEYSDVEGSRKAQAAMNGRRFGENQVIAVFYPENKFAQGEFLELRYRQAKSKLRTEYDPDKALEIYSSVSKHYSSPSSSRYAQDLTVRRLAKSRRFSDIESLIESHKTDPKISQEPFLSTLIRSYGIAGMLDHAIKTFHQMDQFGTPRSTISFNALLSACNQSRQFDRVPQLFDEIPKKYIGLSPDKVSYGILVKSYCEAGHPEKGLEVLREMERKSVEVTAVTSTTILNALYKKGKTEEAEKLWFEMMKTGCELDVASYNVRISNFQGGEPEKVKELIDDMSTLGLKPDTISYNYLMTCYCKRGMLDEAKKVYEGLEGNGCNPNAATFRTLVFYLCLNGLYEQGYKVFKESVRLHKIPDFNTLKHLVEGLVMKKKIKDAKGLIRTVKKTFPPNFLKAWKKLEEELGLVSGNAEAREAKESTKND